MRTQYTTTFRKIGTTEWNLGETIVESQIPATVGKYLADACEVKIELAQQS